MGLSEPVLALIHFSRVIPEFLWTYDYFLTLYGEADYLSKRRRWSLAFPLFIIARYFPLGLIAIDFIQLAAPTHSQVTCTVLFRLYILLLMIITFSTEMLLLLRTLALWSVRRTWSTLIIVLFALIWAAMTVSMVVIQLDVDIGISRTLPVGCTVSGGEILASVKFALIAFFEIVIVGATARGAFRRVGREKRSALNSVLREGNLLYSIPLCVLSIGNAIFFGVVRQHTFGTPTQILQSIMHSIVASRILFEVQCVDASSHFHGPVSLSDIHLPPIALDDIASYRAPFQAPAHPESASCQPLWSDLEDQRSYTPVAAYQDDDEDGDDKTACPSEHRSSWSVDVIEQVPRALVAYRARGEACLS